MSASVDTCWTVIDGAAAGDPSDCAHFAERYVGVVRAALRGRWRGHRLLGEVEDAVQEVFIDCFKDGGALTRADRERGGFRSFLYGVVRNVALRFERKQAHRGSREILGVDGDEFAAADDDLALSFDRAWARQIMREARRIMGRRAEQGDAAQRERVELLRLRFTEGLPIRDIAVRWDRDPALVHRAYARARKEFRTALREVVSFHRPGTDQQIDARLREFLADLEE